MLLKSTGTVPVFRGDLMDVDVTGQETRPRPAEPAAGCGQVRVCVCGTPHEGDGNVCVDCGAVLA